MSVSISGSQITFNDASTQTTAATGFGFKNKLINGNFDIWQRGTSFSTNGVYSADRWYTSLAGTTTVSQETSDVPTGSRYALKWTTGASSSYGQIRQFIETANVKQFAGSTLIASALVKCSSGFAGNMQFEIFYSTTTDTLSGFNGIALSPTITGQITSSGYTQITATFSLPSTAVGLYIGIVPTVAQASGVSVLHSKVQLEQGSTATSFDYRPYGTELALCQRYYYKRNTTAQTFLLRGDGIRWLTVYMPVEMRATPTLSYTYNADGSGTTGTEANVCSTSFDLRSASAAASSSQNPYFTNVTASAEL